MRLLLVEDQADLARHVNRALNRADHDVTIAADGPTAVECAIEKYYDLIILDVNLPGFDGVEVLRQIKNKGVLPRVIMLTARGEVTDRVAGLTAGAYDYLTKPFAIEELLARIDALGRRGGAMKNASVLDIGNIVMDLAFGNNEVVQRFLDENIVALEGDWTRRDPVITREIQKFGHSGVPTNIIFRPDGSSSLLPEVLTPSIVLYSLESD